MQRKKPTIQLPKQKGVYICLKPIDMSDIYMAAAQNVRSGSSPGPTHDPDLRSRPPIQTFRKDLIQTFDPDLWNDIIYW